MAIFIPYTVLLSLFIVIDCTFTWLLACVQYTTILHSKLKDAGRYTGMMMINARSEIRVAPRV